MDRFVLWIIDDISALDCRLNERKMGRFIINTKKYKGYHKSLEKLIEVTDEELKVMGMRCSFR